MNGSNITAHLIKFQKLCDDIMLADVQYDSTLARLLIYIISLLMSNVNLLYSLLCRGKNWKVIDSKTR